MRLRSRQLICRIGSTPLLTRKCAAARLDMWAFDPAPSVTLIAVTSLRSASARAMNSAGSVETGGESSAVTTKLPSRRCFCSSLMALLDDCTFVAESILSGLFLSRQEGRHGAYFVLQPVGFRSKPRV